MVTRLFPTAKAERHVDMFGRAYWLVRLHPESLLPIGEGKTRRAAWSSAADKLRDIRSQVQEDVQ